MPIGLGQNINTWKKLQSTKMLKSTFIEAVNHLFGMWHNTNQNSLEKEGVCFLKL